MTLDKVKTEHLNRMVGIRVRCITEFPAVKVGTEGRIIEFYGNDKGCGVMVEWDKEGIRDGFGRGPGQMDETKFLEILVGDKQL